MSIKLTFYPPLQEEALFTLPVRPPLSLPLLFLIPKGSSQIPLLLGLMNLVDWPAPLLFALPSPQILSILVVFFPFLPFLVPPLLPIFSHSFPKDNDRDEAGTGRRSGPLPTSSFIEVEVLMTPTLSRRMDVKNRLPRFMRKLVDYIMRYALDLEGIFRLSIAKEPLGL